MGSIDSNTFSWKRQFWVKESAFLSFLNRVHRSRVDPRRRFFKLPVGECSASGVISALGDASDFYIHFDHFY